MKKVIDDIANTVQEGYLKATILETDKKRNQHTIDYLESVSQFNDIHDAINSLPNRSNLKSKILNLTILAKHVEETGEFEDLYGQYSKDSHALKGTKQIVLKDGKATLRRTEEVLTIAKTEYSFINAIDALLNSLEPFLSYYRMYMEIEEPADELSFLT